jgi:antitoxin ParD1/3/4
MGTRNVSLPPELEQFIDAKVAAGEYAHASEVVREGLRLLMRDDAEKLEWLRNAIAEGVASVERGEVYTREEVVDYIKSHGRRRLSSKPEADAL